VLRVFALNHIGLEGEGVVGGRHGLTRTKRPLANVLDEKHGKLRFLAVDDDGDALRHDASKRLSLGRGLSLFGDATVGKLDDVGVFDAAKFNRSFHVDAPLVRDEKSRGLTTSPRQADLSRGRR
jgi:hypothetical protein